MENQAPSVAVKELEAQIRRILRPLDLPTLSSKPRAALVDLNQVLSDARIYCTDYELSESREEQLDNARAARRYLNDARKDILTASEHNVFNAVDVAHMTARIDQIIADLQ